MRPTISVQLSPDQIRDADDLGARRQANARAGRMIPGNNLIASDQEQLRIHIEGARGECAAHVVYPLPWYRGLQTGLADLGTFIDVKTIKVPRHSLMVPMGTVRFDWAYVLVSAADHPRYEIVGWLWGAVLESVPISEPQPNRPAHVVRSGSNLLRDPWELVAIVDRVLMRSA